MQLLRSLISACKIGQFSYRNGTCFPLIGHYIMKVECYADRVAGL